MNLNSAASMVIMERCQLVGGITWYCFGGLILTEDELSLEIATLPLSQLPTVDKDINLSPRIFHRYCICNTDKMDTASGTVCVKFGSTKIAEMVYKHLGDFEMNHMVRLIESKISGAYANLKGNLFETFMHDYIYMILNLNQQNLSTLENYPHLFFSTQDFDDKHGKYGRPRRKNQEGIVIGATE